MNDYNFPTKGFINNASLSLALPVADLKYYKFDIDHKSYYPITKDLTLKVKASMGLAQGYGGKGLPFFERYYSGGPSSLRGFANNSLGAKYNSYDKDKKKLTIGTGKAKGGEFVALAGASFIAPVPFIKDSENLRISAFVDAGTISEELKEIGTKNLRAAAGLAINWHTPIGPIGIYVARPLISKKKDDIKNFSFTLGTTF
ncbi:MAG: BamA/TamA family outer membrane protein [Candidatus Thioglobus sp.]|nr:MAG: BamA/TamA family outer membrane protein [Candidatus Thioglobus sp.]